MEKPDGSPDPAPSPAPPVDDRAPEPTFAEGTERDVTDSGAHPQSSSSGAYQQSSSSGGYPQPTASGGYPQATASGAHPRAGGGKRPPVQRAVALSGLPPYAVAASDDPPPPPASLTRNPMPHPAADSPPAQPRQAPEAPPARTPEVTHESPAQAAPERRPDYPPPTFAADPARPPAGETDAERTQVVAVQRALAPGAAVIDHVPVLPGPTAGDRFRPWLVPLVLVAVVAAGAAVLGGNQLQGRTGDDALPVPGTYETTITLNPPGTSVEASLTPSASAVPSASASASPTPSASASPSSRPSATLAAGRSSAPAARPQAGAPPVGRANTSGANLALSRPASASSSENETVWPASAAVDGDPASRWSSAFSDPQWISVDLGEVWTITAVEVVWERAYATSYHVDVSVDGSTWKTVYSTASGAEGTTRIQAGKTGGRYVRVVGDSRSNGYGYSMFELRVF